MGKLSVLYCAFLIGCYFLHGHALECYVCKNQETNIGKCTQTVKTCEQGEDVCLTEIRWGSTPYWSQGTKKQYYISKRCSTKKECERTRLHNMPDCTHIWYTDWKCSECCKGDKCNYFVISAAKADRAHFGVIAFAALASLLGLRFLQ